MRSSTRTRFILSGALLRFAAISFVPEWWQSGLLPLPHVQFWETENSWRLDSSHRGGHRRNSPSVVDASDVRTVSALKTSPVRSHA